MSQIMSGSYYGTQTYTIDRSSEQKTIHLDSLPEDDVSMIAEEVEGLWTEIFSSNLFSFEQSLEIDQWKKEFLIKHNTEGSETAAFALFYLYKKHLLPFKAQILDPIEKIKIDHIICILKLIMGLTLPLNEEVDSFINRNLAYCDEKATPIVQYEVQTLMTITSIYDEQTKQLYQAANENRELITKNLIQLKDNMGSLKLQSQVGFKKLNEVRDELDKRLQKSAEQDEVLKIQAKELQELHNKKSTLLNQLDEITKGY